MKTYLIYKFTSPSGKSYIGQTCDLVRRERSHKNGNNGCVAFSNAINKYGFENFTKEILVDDLTLNEANKQEENLISEHNTMFPNGYNLKSGGLNNLHSEETKTKIRESMPDNSGINNPNYGKLVSEETRRLMHELKVGENNPFFGKTHTQDALKKQSEIKLGAKNPMFGKTGELCHNFGRIHTEEQRRKQGLAQIGLKQTEEAQEKKREKLAKVFIITFPDGHEEVIKGLSKFCKENKISAGSMSARGKANGFKCRPYTN